MPRRSTLKFKPRDAVCRREDPYDRKSPMMHGFVIEHYTEPGYPELYVVRWTHVGNKQLDTPLDRRGYLSHGIESDPNPPVVK